MDSGGKQDGNRAAAKGRPTFLRSLRKPWLVKIVRRVRLLIEPDRRTVDRLRRSSDARVLQPWPTTSPDRYPALFDRVASDLAGLESPRILSFGCASGEETRALRSRMPDARIVGIDPNRRALSRARAADPSPLSDYRLGTAPEPGETFDAIFAMAVFRHGSLEADKPENCSGILEFARFEAGLLSLDRALAPGGLLAMGNAHFRLSDTALATRYRVELRLQSDPAPSTLLYGRDNRRIDGASEDAVLFRKS